MCALTTRDYKSLNNSSDANLGSQFDSSRKREADGELPPSEWPGECLWGIFSIANWYRKGNPIVGSTIPSRWDWAI